MNRESITTLAVLAVILIIVAGTAFYLQQRAVPEDIGEDAVEAIFGAPAAIGTFTTINGQPLDLTSEEGTILLVQSWASWCPPCVGQLQLLSAVQKDYPNIRVLAVNRSENERIAQRFLNKQTGMENLLFVFDADDRFFAEVDAYNMPHTVVFDETGVLVFEEPGPTTRNQLDAILQQLTE